ncbi:hypothetical protein CkaCkLH20_08679 [Colletotrichum karsti]|uniref:Uncharacterized protein n=1 Tax=Colletotrichum karsti TaxID=1095194 RepID=A0A9P6LIP1_9PEZI|nr:uncharacterized protein CkaCkLH20_08679 [Colletotrichum karsti]KAF9873945.1 hypothetical protein CkaCkLH20_08679 [Colletotrichum karsti]
MAQEASFQSQEDTPSRTHENGSSQTESGLFNLEQIKSRPKFSEQDVFILNTLSYGVYSPSREAAEEVAYYLDGFCPPLEEQEAANNWLWNIWDILLDVARSPDTTAEIQERLISILQALQRCAKGETKVYGSEARVWKDLPYLFECLDPCFNDATLYIDEEGRQFTPKSAQRWLNTTAFAARIMGAGLAASAYGEAMRAISLALEEEEQSTIPGIADCRMQIACLWITHAAKPLLTWAQENVGYIDNGAQYIEAGPLYRGPETMCLQRWGFWIERFEELGKEGSGLSAETREIALTAAEAMRTIEVRAGRTLSE